MKRFLMVLTAGILVFSVIGCHSGTMRGVGSDMEELGENMQK